jgi:hypothetical protein
MKARIHRGATEVGGSCVELQAENGECLVLDLGLPLEAEPAGVSLPPVAGLEDGGDPLLLGVLLSHAHPDHFGLIEEISAEVPIYMGQATSRILLEANFFTPLGLTREPDRLVSVYKAAVRSGRSLVIDLYGAAVAAATGAVSIPQADWDRIRVYVPQTQRVRVKESAQFWRVNDLGASRVFAEELAAEPDRWVMCFRQSMLRELERAGCLREARAVWLMWPGYLDREAGQAFRASLASLGIDLAVVHASGAWDVAIGPPKTWSRNWSPTPPNSAVLPGPGPLYRARFGSIDGFRPDS